MNSLQSDYFKTSEGKFYQDLLQAWNAFAVREGYESNYTFSCKFLGPNRMSGMTLTLGIVTTSGVMEVGGPQ